MYMQSNKNNISKLFMHTCTVVKISFGFLSADAFNSPEMEQKIVVADYQFVCTSVLVPAWICQFVAMCIYCFVSICQCVYACMRCYVRICVRTCQVRCRTLVPEATP